ncbi:MAG: YjbE family putative metal transport protein [Ktedonobacteraceae bacterium]|nr:YjbE family putative metal transport protein [Ktedonobacteraceae bacterium]
MASWLPVLGSIILVDLVLSGDNALVIGAVAAGIPTKLRWIAFFVGGGGAILLRILLTYSVTLLLHIPYIEVFGGVILIIITVRLLLQWWNDKNGTAVSANEEDIDDKKGPGSYLKKNHIVGAILTILVADVTMSLDNIIAVAALAKYQTSLLFAGLVISIILLLIGSAFVSFIIERLSWLMWVVGVILAITAANMIVNNNDVFGLLPNEAPWWSIVIYIIVFLVIAALTLLYPGFRWVRRRRSRTEK